MADIINIGKGAIDCSGNLTDSAIKEIESLCENGILVDKWLAAQLGISEDEFINFLNDDPRVKKAIDKGESNLAISMMNVTLELAYAGNDKALKWLQQSVLGMRGTTPSIKDVDPNMLVEVEYIKHDEAG